MQVLTDLTKELLKDKQFADAFDEAIREEIGAALRDARKGRGLSQDDVAERMGITRPRVSQIESVEGHSISIGVLHRYARALGCRLDIVIRDPDSADRDVQVYMVGPAMRSPGLDLIADYAQPFAPVVRSEYAEPLYSRAA
jgi:transcriptional regulator with XRE-family HTH domain